MLPGLAEAGRMLAPALARYARRGDAVVLGIVRGGTPAAAEVARLLALPLDLLLIRRLLLPRGPADPVCAVSAAGLPYEDPELAADSVDPALGAYLSDAREAFSRRVAVCRGNRPPTPLAGKTVILVDNGVHTGGTVRIAVRALRALGAGRVVLAVPVAAPERRAALEVLADEVACLAWPEPFGNVALWYAEYRVPDEEGVRGLLDEFRAPAPTG